MTEPRRVDIDGEARWVSNDELRQLLRGLSGGSTTRDEFLDLLVRDHGFAREVRFRGLSGKRRFRCDAAPAALEDILTDASRGRTARFARRDHVEEAWRIVNAIVDEDTPLHTYEPGSWGPRAADRLTASAGGSFAPAHAVRAPGRSLSRSAQPARG